jgi:hypothetical protein
MRAGVLVSVVCTAVLVQGDLWTHRSSAVGYLSQLTELPRFGKVVDRQDAHGRSAGKPEGQKTVLSPVFITEEEQQRTLRTFEVRRKCVYGV